MRGFAADRATRVQPDGVTNLIECDGIGYVTPAAQGSSPVAAETPVRAAQRAPAAVKPAPAPAPLPAVEKTVRVPSPAPVSKAPAPKEAEQLPEGMMVPLPTARAYLS